MFSAAYRKWEIRLEGAGRGYKIVDWKKQIKESQRHRLMKDEFANTNCHKQRI
jgi:hypothetical protein